MLNTHPKAGNSAVPLFLLTRQFFAFRLFEGLNNVNARWPVTLITAILPQAKALRYAIALVSHFFVMYAAAERQAGKENIAQGIGNKSVLNGVPLPVLLRRAAAAFGFQQQAIE